ncbi:MAG: DAK2 domain-containing protein, partial [Actinomycetes bacterium]
MPVLAALTAADLRQVVLRFRDALRDHQEELNRLNVYPVPDGDTGTNMTLTLESVATELREAETMGEVCEAIAHGSLMGARGNSGVITSQILRGLAETFRELESIGAPEVLAALRRSADAAYQAVMRPVEGTILTVAREAAEAAEAAGATTVEAVLDAAAVGAEASVQRTPELLPALRDAGVVDAGGRGYTLLIAAFLEVVAERPIPEPVLGAAPDIVRAHLAGEDISDLRYEVMFLLDAPDSTIDAFKAAWMAIGDSIVVVGGDGLWNCHVHTDDIGGAIEAGIDAGRPRNIRVTDLIEQVEEEAWVRGHDHAGPAATPVTTAVVAVGVGVGVQRLLRSLGVQEIVAGGQSMNPSTAQILEAVERCPAEAVIVLPNNKNIIPVARQVDDLSGRRVEVVPTVSVLEALAALVVYDPDADCETNVAAMEAGARAVRAGEVTQAVRDSVAECGPIREGDWLAISPAGIGATARSAADAAFALVDALVDDDSEIVTVLVGADARAGEVERVREHLRARHPHVELEVHDGGQPLYPYLIG